VTEFEAASLAEDFLCVDITANSAFPALTQELELSLAACTLEMRYEHTSDYVSHYDRDRTATPDHTNSAHNPAISACSVCFAGQRTGFPVIYRSFYAD
jgi:hypothetical protein